MKKGNSHHVAVLFGGDSPEREVSLSSGAAVCSALEEAGIVTEPIERNSPLEMLEAVRLSLSDVFFIALHGSWGEDGRLQAALDLMGKVYTGSGPTACALAMDKRASKALFAMNGVPTPDAIYLSIDNCPAELSVARAVDALGKWSKMVVKPSGCGSTVGVSIVSSAGDVEEALAAASLYDSSVIVEEYIPGREITVTVWKRVQCFSPSCHRDNPQVGFLQLPGEVHRRENGIYLSARLSPEAEKNVSGAAVAAHRALGCRVYSRVDMRLSDGGQPSVLEVNTAPGMTATSLVPKSAAARGWSFAELSWRIVQSSIKLRCKEIAFYRGGITDISVIRNFLVPLGTLTESSSPTLLPITACPTGLLADIRLAAGSDSSEPTIV